MDKKELIKRCNDLEIEIRLLKEELQPVSKSKFIKFTGKTITILKSNWVLLSFLTAIFTAFYVNIIYDIDYFENYRNLSAIKKLSGFYSELGDKMMARSEFNAAEDAYRRALEIYPQNMEATFGVVKTRVFKPPEGDKYYEGDVVDAKLDHLKSKFPDDYQVNFIQGIRFWHRKKMDQAKLYFRKSLEQNPNFAGGYLMLGYVYQGSLELDLAIENFKKCLEIDPGYSMANNNLGFTYMLLGNFKEANKYIEKAYNISPKLNMVLNLGDTHIYMGNYQIAKNWHEHGLSQIADPEQIEKKYLVSEWTANYLPLTSNDKTSIKSAIIVHEFNHKKAFLHYSLSFDFALLKDFRSADREFESGVKLDKQKFLNRYISHKIKSIQNFVSPPEDINHWFEAKKKQLLNE